MTKVNIIAERSWILNRCAQELADRLGWSVNDQKTYDVEYHCPYWLGLYRSRPATRVGFFTHGFDRAHKTAKQFDAAVCMNQRMHALLSTRVPSTIIRPGVDAPPRLPVFGVCGRTYRDGRKGQDLVRRAVEAGHEVVAIGPGPWPCETLSTDPTRGSEWVEHFWRKIDYLLVTATDEGGPMPVLEAVARRVPVIAPDVGWCWELPVIRYERGNWASLERILHDLTVTPTWAEWADAHQRFFESLTSSSSKEAVA